MKLKREHLQAECSIGHHHTGLETMIPFQALYINLFSHTAHPFSMCESRKFPIAPSFPQPHLQQKDIEIPRGAWGSHKPKSKVLKGSMK